MGGKTKTQTIPQASKKTPQIPHQKLTQQKPMPNFQAIKISRKHNNNNNNNNNSNNNNNNNNNNNYIAVS